MTSSIIIMIIFMVKQKGNNVLRKLIEQITNFRAKIHEQLHFSSGEKTLVIFII